MLQLRLPWLRRRIAEGLKLYGLQLEQMTFITGVQHLGRTRFAYGNKNMEGILILDDFGWFGYFGILGLSSSSSSSSSWCESGKPVCYKCGLSIMIVTPQSLRWYNTIPTETGATSSSCQTESSFPCWWIMICFPLSRKTSVEVSAFWNTCSYQIITMNRMHRNHCK